MRYSGRLLQTAIVLGAVVLAAGCGGGGGAHQLPEELASGLRQSIDAANVARRDAALSNPGDLRAAADRLARLRAQAQREGQLTADARALVDRALIAQTAARDIRQTISRADTSAQASDSAANDIAIAATPPSDVLSTVQLEDAARNILPDVTCDVAWAYMTPQEHDDAYAHNERRAFPQVVENASIDAIRKYVIETVLAHAAPPIGAAFKLEQYVSGLADKARELAPANLQTLVTLPGGAQYTRAAYYYARLCLRPPES